MTKKRTNVNLDAEEVQKFHSETQKKIEKLTKKKTTLSKELNAHLIFINDLHSKTKTKQSRNKKRA